jgi:hypothetical protein
MLTAMAASAASSSLNDIEHIVIFMQVSVGTLLTRCTVGKSRGSLPKFLGDNLNHSLPTVDLCVTHAKPRPARAAGESASACTIFTRYTPVECAARHGASRRVSAEIACQGRAAVFEF